MEQEIFSNLSKEQEIHLFRIIQELINNSIKHGKASQININFTHSVKGKIMNYTDNGKGITNNQVNKSKGIGLKNIFSRANIIQAKATIDTKYQNGFCFTLTL